MQDTVNFLWIYKFSWKRWALRKIYTIFGYKDRKEVLTIDLSISYDFRLEKIEVKSYL